MSFRIGLSAILLASTGLPAFGLTGSTSEEPARHVLNFDDVELSALIADVSIVTGYTFIVHPDVKSKRVTVTSSSPLTKDGIFEVFLSTLRVHGFTAVPAGKDSYRIVPEQSAVGEAGLRGEGGNSSVTEIIKLDHFSAQEAAQMVKPLIDAQGQVIANARSNTLVVVDYASNLPRVRKLIARLDEDQTTIETLPLLNVPAAEMQAILTSLSQTAGEGGVADFQAIASKSGNALILRGDEMAVKRALSVAQNLDVSDRAEDTLRIVSLKNADASEVVPVLEKVAAAMSTRRGEISADGSASTIAFHAPTNSLVLSAPTETLLAMERVIENLDRRRAQVLVEAIIVEMSDDTARELGLQFLLSGTGDSTVPFASTNYSRSAPNLLALAGALSSDTPLSGGGTGNAFSQSAVTSLLGLTGLSVGVGGQSGNTLFGAILNAVETDTNSRVLSKPFNMTLDNGTSSLLVGQEVPIVTGEVLGDGNSNPFRTVDRREIGIRLDVTPRISSDDTVRLEINQEVSSIAGAVGQVTPDLIFNKREITTSVLADSGEIIVIGGLIEQSETDTMEKVPLLGDIPLAGRAFRNEGTARNRKNLMVFIRPTVIRDAQSARDVTSRSYRYVRAEELWSGKDGAPNSLDAFVNEVLGAEVPQ